MVPGVRTVLIQPGLAPKEQAALIKEAAGGPLTVALECTGVESSVHTAIYVSSSYLCSSYSNLVLQSMQFGGKVFIIGVGKNEQLFPFMHLSANEIDVKFQYRYANQVCLSVFLSLNRVISHHTLVRSTPKPSVSLQAVLSTFVPLLPTGSLSRTPFRLSMSLLILRKVLSRFKFRIKQLFLFLHHLVYCIGSYGCIKQKL